jgi:hypothetical protein
LEEAEILLLVQLRPRPVAMQRRLETQIEAQPLNVEPQAQGDSVLPAGADNAGRLSPQSTKQCEPPQPVNRNPKITVRPIVYRLECPAS